MIGIVALIVVGPKDLPGMFREMGRFTARIKGMARDFQRAMEDAADDSGVGDITKTLRNVTNPKAMGLDALNKATGNITDWSPDEKAEPSATPRGPETAKMTEERKEKAQKIHDSMAKKAEERLATEAAAKEAAAKVAAEPPAPTPAPAPAPASDPVDPAPQPESKT